MGLFAGVGQYMPSQTLKQLNYKHKTSLETLLQINFKVVAMSLSMVLGQ